MAFFVYSTLTCDQDYVQWHHGADSKTYPAEVVTIKGGSSVANNVRGALFTPRGVMTKVTDEQMLLLQANLSFLDHVKNKFVSYDKHHKKVENAVKDMQSKDKSAPITPADYIHIDNKKEGIDTTEMKFEAKKLGAQFLDKKAENQISDHEYGI